MIRELEGLPAGVFGFVADGDPSRDEIDEVMAGFEATAKERYDVALLVEFLPTLASDAALRETRFENWLAARGRTRRFAFVADHRWRESFEAFAHFAGCEARMFPPGERDAALAWLLAAPFLADEAKDT